MRAKSFSFWVILSWKAASLGAISRSTAWNSGVLIVLLNTPYGVVARSRVRPVRSRATIVFSKVGGAGSAAIASISLSCSAIAASRAGWKCSTLTWSKGGTPP